MNLTVTADLPIVIVGNKKDLTEDREVESLEGETLAEKWGCKYHETSARSGTNIHPVFRDIVRLMRTQDEKRREGRGPRRLGRKCVIL